MATLINLLLAIPNSWLISVAIFYLVYRVTRFYTHVYSLPPGPFPLPFVGNMFSLRSNEENWSVVLYKVADEYGPVFTVWYGESPRVMVTDIDLIKDKFKRNEFSGRKHDLINQLLNTEKRQNIVAADFGPTWETLRRVSHAAVMRYAVTEKLNDLVIDCVDHTIDLIVKTEGLNKRFVPFDYICNMFYNIMSESAIGQRFVPGLYHMFDLVSSPRYEPHEMEYKIFDETQVNIYKEYGDILSIWEMFPITRFGRRYNKFKKIWNDLAEHFITKFVEHYKDYDENVIRDFCDTLITAKNEAIKAGEESASILTDSNLGMVVSDLVLAGTDTSQMAFRWILLHILYNKDFLAKLRHEIDVEIGDRMPTHEDKTRCHYVMAFITESLRFSPMPPIALPHKTVVNTQLAGFTIPKDTEVVGLASYIMHREENFAEPNILRPERFLDNNGHYVHYTKHKAFTPFGFGRRICLGDKMAINDLFLALVRFIQKTNRYRMELYLEDSEPFIVEPKDLAFIMGPKEYQISMHNI